MEGSDHRSICRLGPSDAQSSPSPKTPPLGSSASFASSRLNFLPAVDRRSLRSDINDLFDCAEARQDIQNDYGAMHDQLRAQELRGDRLKRQLHDVCEFLGPIRQYFNQRYHDMRDKLEDPERKVAEFQDELADREHAWRKSILKTALLKLKTARHAEQVKNRCQLAVLQDYLDLVIESSQNANAQAKIQIEDAQDHFFARLYAIMQELAMAQRDMGEIKV
uniref:Uncharacterized protein n=1 Tax=Peronospora matthiolae TaxID=2874970 RepID=A0AAV1TGL2_9STRA